MVPKMLPRECGADTTEIDSLRETLFGVDKFVANVKNIPIILTMLGLTQHKTLVVPCGDLHICLSYSVGIDHDGYCSVIMGSNGHFTMRRLDDQAHAARTFRSYYDLAKVRGGRAIVI